VVCCQTTSVSAALGGYHVIQKEARLFYRTSSSVRLWWEFKEPKGPKTAHALRIELLTVPRVGRSYELFLDGFDQAPPEVRERFFY